MNGKRWYESKTLWFNILAVVVLVANQFGFASFELDAEIATGIVAVINMLLRFVTRLPIA